MFFSLSAFQTQIEIALRLVICSLFFVTRFTFICICICICKAHFKNPSKVLFGSGIKLSYYTVVHFYLSFSYASIKTLTRVVFKYLIIQLFRQAYGFLSTNIHNIFCVRSPIKHSKYNQEYMTEKNATLP